jgi:signal transduction histidine kinase
MMLRSKVNFFLELWSQKQKLLASDELAKVNEKLKKSNHDLNHFAFIVSHDLQAPVRHILILSRLILEEESGGLGEEARKLLALLGKSAEQLQGMITDILAFSRAAKKVKLNKVDGNEVISRVLGDLEIDITAKNAKVAVNSVPTDLYTSDNLLYQLFCNLITNALKFCVDRSPKISISCQEEARVYRFSVSDNGPGIDPGSKDDIFQLFHRLPSAKSIPGTGLGLAICRKIVEAMGGDIRFESELGKGTTFYFTVRRVPQALAGGSSTAGNPEKAA